MIKKRIITTVMAVCMAAAVVLAGCGSKDAETGNDNANNAEAGKDETSDSDEADDAATEEDSNAALSGTITLAGSTSMEKLCEAMSESFMEPMKGVM